MTDDTPAISPAVAERATMLAAENERKAAELAAAAAATAVALASDRQAQAVKLAVEGALRNQSVDAALDAHGTHLSEINGSQSKMAELLSTQGITLARIEEKIGLVTATKNARSVAVVNMRTFILQCFTVLVMITSAAMGVLGATGNL